MKLWGKPRKLVSWAALGELIPLKCVLCGTIYVVPNVEPILVKQIAISTYNIQNMQRANRCAEEKHGLLYLKPCKRLYKERRY